MKEIKTKNKILKTLIEVFALLLFVLTVLLIAEKMSYLTRDKDDAPIHKRFMELEKNSVSTFFVGNSHSFCSINTDLLYDEYGIDSFMMATSGQTIAMDYYAIKELIKYQNPKTVYLEMGYAIHDWDVINNEMSHKFFDGMPIGSIKLEAIKEFVEEEEDRTYFLFTLGQYHSRFNYLTEKDYEPTLSSKRGRYYSDRIMDNMWAIEPIVDPDEKEAIPDNEIAAIDRIVELCRDNDIELIMYIVPFNGMYQDEGQTEQIIAYQKIYNSLADYALEHDLEYHNLFWELEEIGVDYSTDYLDSQHFNCYGQDKFTRYMVEKGYIR